MLQYINATIGIDIQPAYPCDQTISVQEDLNKGQILFRANNTRLLQETTC